jgi:hypothetical protein
MRPKKSWSDRKNLEDDKSVVIVFELSSQEESTYFVDHYRTRTAGQANILKEKGMHDYPGVHFCF